MGPPGGRTDRLLEGRLVERSNFRGLGRLCIRGDDPGSFLTVICGPLAWELSWGQYGRSGLAGTSTYGETGPLFSVGEPFAAEPSLELVDIRDGEEFEIGGANAGRFLGLGLRGCGEGREATAVDMLNVPSERGEQRERVQSNERQKWTQSGVWALNTRRQRKGKKNQKTKKIERAKTRDNIRGKRESITLRSMRGAVPPGSTEYHVSDASGFQRKVPSTRDESRQRIPSGPS